MKKIKYTWLTVLLFGLLLISCEDFLELRPSSQSVAEEVEQTDTIVYHSASELEAALAGVYDDFRNEYFELDYFVNGDAQSDDAYAGADNPANFQIDAYTLDATNSNVSRDWGYLYTTVGKANLVINNAEAVPDATLSDFDKKQIKAEASAIRAFIYFQLVQLWGDVPLQLKEVTTISAGLLPEIYPLLFPPRKPKEEVYAQIIADLEFALPYVRTTAINKGYVTRGFVNALLAKVNATKEPKDWAKVESYCNDVITGGYNLLPNYDDLWNNENENSTEAIFEINYEGTSSSGNWGAGMFIGFDWKKFNIPSNDLVRAFDEENDVIRKAASITFMDVSGKWSDSHWPQTAYPFIYKYRIYSSPSPQNYIFLRLADIILLKAEALNEQGDVNGAANLVNQIRSRVNLSDTPAETQEEMRLAIEKERRLELAFEGHRWFDLKRTGRAVEVINSVTDQDGNSLGYQLNENRLLWPIPQAEMDKNAKLIQNPGY